MLSGSSHNIASTVREKARQIVLVVGQWCSCKKVKEGAICRTSW